MTPAWEGAERGREGRWARGGDDSVDAGDAGVVKLPLHTVRG